MGFGSTKTGRMTMPAFIPHVAPIATMAKELIQDRLNKMADG